MPLIALLVVAFLGACAAAPVEEPDGGPALDAAPAPDAAIDRPDAEVAAPDAEPAPDADPAPDVLARFGTESTLDVATWNLRFFPSTTETPELVAGVIRGLDLDLIAVEEVRSQSGLDALLAALPGYSARVSDPFPAPPARIIARVFLFRSDRLTAVQEERLLAGDPDFPRVPFLVRFAYDHAGLRLELDAIVVHLEAGGTAAEVELRTRQLAKLEALVRARVDAGQAQILVLGDFNQGFAGRDGPVAWAPFRSAPDRYTIETYPLFVAGGWTHLSGAMLDHIVTTAALDDEVGDASPLIVHLEQRIPSYEARVSDHLPVVFSLSPR